MPNYEKLTDEERQQAKEKFDLIFEKINAYYEAKQKKLEAQENASEPNEKKEYKPFLNYEEELAKFNKRLDDEKMVARYRLTKEIEEIKAAKKTAFEEARREVFGENGMKDMKDDLLSRSIVFLCKHDGSPESKQYNKELLESYKNDPINFTRNRLRNILKFDVTPLVEAKDDIVKQLEFFKDNMGVSIECQDFGSASIFEDKNLSASPLYIDVTKNIREIIEATNYPDMTLPESNSLEFFAFPELDKATNEELSRNIKKVFPGINKNDPKYGVTSKRGESFALRESPYILYNKFKEKGLTVDKNVFLKYKAIETNPQTKETKEVALHQFLDGKANVTVQERTPDEINRILGLTKNYDDKLHNIFINKFNNKTHKDSYNYNNLEKESKGGFFDKIFRKPSNQFKAYMSALKDYNDPNSKDYLNKSRLTKAGNEYIKHVERHGGLDENRMNSMRKYRFNLVKNTLATFEDMEKEKVEENLLKVETGENVVKIPAVEEKDVNLDNQIFNDIKLIDKENNIQKEEIEELE